MISVLWIVGVAVSAIYGRVFILDDAFITFRYARNFANGLGFVWNPHGPHTEGFTSLLHVLLLAPGFRLGLNPEIFSFGFNATALLLTCFALFFASRNLLSSQYRDFLPWLSALAPALIIVDPLVWANASSGLETMVYAAAIACVVSSYAHYVTTNGERSFRAMCTFAVLSFLLRPEGIILTALVSLQLLGAKNWKQFGKLVLAVGVPIGAVMVFRYVYFGDIFPNSFYVKVRNPHAPFFAGLQYERLFGIRTLPMFALGLLGFVGAWRDKGLQVIVGFIIAQLVFYALVDPIMGDYDRFLLPAQILLAIPATLGVARLIRGSSPILTRGSVALLLAIVDIHSVRAPRTQSMIALVTGAHDNAGVPITETLRALPHAAQLTMAYTEAGRVGYYAPEAFVDLVGLNHNGIAREPNVLRRANLVFAENPDIILVPVVDSVPPFHAYPNVPSMGAALFDALLRDQRLSSYSPIIRFRDPDAAYTWIMFLNSASVYRSDIEAFVRTQPGLCFHV